MAGNVNDSIGVLTIGISDETTTRTDSRVTVAGGIVDADGMTVSPETTPESGYLTVTIAGVEYQIPLYAA